MMAVTPFPKTPEKARLTPRQEIAITALVAGKTNGQAAKAAHVDAKTLFRWRTEDRAFMAGLRSARDEAFTEALASLRRVTTAAVATCETLMRAPNEPTVRLAAARVVLAVALRSNEQVSVEDRLRALEERVSGV
jgi:hypothetical protein